MNQSNRISQQITGITPFPNVAGLGRDQPDKVDAILTQELTDAGIEVLRWPECLRDAHGGEPQSTIWGSLCGWKFERAWYYWVARGPGIPVFEAITLHEQYGRSVRVDGHCGCPHPLLWGRGNPIGMYHVDNSVGLKALADVILALKWTGEELLKRIDIKEDEWQYSLMERPCVENS